MRQDLPEDELAKIAVVGDQNALLMSRDGKDFGIWKPWSVLSYDGFYIMTLVREKGGNPELSAFV